MNIRTVMTPDPVVCAPNTDLFELARTMRDLHIGDVIVGDEHGPLGIVTDRDIVVRALAGGSDALRNTAADVCTTPLHTVDVDDSVDEVIAVMERHSLRRIPVISDGRAVGIVSLGDLAERLDPRSLLAEISAAPPDPA